MSIAKDVAQAIVKSGFWPDANANAVLTLCYLAEAEGHHPAVVYRDYHIMQGKPAKKAEAILRDFVAAGGKIEWHQLDDTAADATFTHSSGQARIAWDIGRAQRAGLKSAMWGKYPRQMLRSRCISEGVRTVYPGATSGLYEEGEVADIVAETIKPNEETPAHEPDVERQGQGQDGEVSPAVSELSDADWAMLVRLVEATGTDTVKICEAYGVTSLKQFSPDQFKDAKAVLEKRLGKKARSLAEEIGDEIRF